MSTLESLLQRAERLYQDLRFAAVREWKQRTGGLAIGFLPVYVPREVLHAMGVLPVAVMGAGDDLEIIRGDAYYQSYICHLPRSTIELGLNGALDCLDGMLFPATCDVIRNLSGMWMMQVPGKYAHYLDVPQDFSPEVGGAFYRHEIEQIAEALAARGAKPLTATALRASIAVYNENKALVDGLYGLRQKEPWRVATAELYLLLRAGCVLPVEEHSAMLRDYLAAVREADRTPMDQARVLLAGSFCEQPPLGLIKTLERAGCYIVDDDFVQVHRWIKGPIRASGDDPLGDLVLAYLRQGIQSPIRYIDEAKKGQELVDRVEQSGAEGVIFCAPSFCDPALLDQPMAVAAMDKAGVPWTAFKYSENTGQFQVIREQAGTFADSIKLWSE
ncbi:MAG TPA: benzoyl-CoA reductase subunit C [Planctomycetota bacterium]